MVWYAVVAAFVEPGSTASVYSAVTWLAWAIKVNRSLTVNMQTVGWCSCIFGYMGWPAGVESLLRAHLSLTVTRVFKQVNVSQVGR